jgi:hypothetical protein
MLQGFETFEHWWASVLPTIKAAMLRGGDVPERKLEGSLENIRIIAEDAWIHGGLSYHQFALGPPSPRRRGASN